MFEDSDRVIRSRKPKDRQYNGQMKKDKQQAIRYKTTHRNLKIEHH